MIFSRRLQNEYAIGWGIPTDLVSVMPNTLIAIRISGLVQQVMLKNVADTAAAQPIYHVRIYSKDCDVQSMALECTTMGRIHADHVGTHKVMFETAAKSAASSSLAF